MSVFHENMLIGASGQAPAATGISRSLRFNSSDSAYLSRTPASAGNRKTYTFSFWIKRVNAPAAVSYVYGSFPTASIEYLIGFNSSQQFYIEDYPGSTALNVTSSAVFRDFSAWYHFVVAVDTTQATAANRIKLYVNGSQITQLATATYPTQNFDTNVWDTGAASAISVRGRTFQNPSSHYLADPHWVDGQALDPTSFGEFDATTGVWNPKAYSGSYGTNGFHLEFADNSAATATTLGKDTSGNGNNWTPNNLSVTAGAGNDSLVDVPTNGAQTDTGVGGEVRGNYCTGNPLVNYGTYPSTLSNGNLDVVGNSSGSFGSSIVGTIGVSSGKWYFEATPATAIAPSNGQVVGVVGSQYNPAADADSYFSRYSFGYAYRKDGQKENNNTAASYGASYALGDVIGVAYDLDAGTITFYKNGTSQGQAYSGLSGTFYPAVYAFGSRGWTFNFGQRPFAYTAPSGFKALNTANLPAPLVTKPNTVFDVALWTGNSGTQSITLPGGFSPDLVWGKTRSAATYYHVLYDTVRGTGPTKSLYSNATDAEGAQSIYTNLTSFDSTGFSLGSTSPNNNILNQSGQTFVGWAWDAGTSTVTNTQGSITGTVRANTTAGFSVFTYTGTGAAGSVGHGLGVAPSLLICKQRNGTADWVVYHSSLGRDKYLILNSTAAQGSITGYWGNSDPTSTVVNFSAGYGGNNGTSNTYVMYAFAPVVGYSSFGSYTGNGSADGPFVYTGFRPRWVICKCSSTNNGYTFWEITDTARGPYNPSTPTLAADLSDAEGSANLGAPPVDMLSNGFKIRTTGSGKNLSGQTYIYAAFAESPFNYARAR